MKHCIRLLLIAVGITACETKSASQADEATTDTLALNQAAPSLDTTTETPYNNDWYSIEVFSLDSVLVNGQLPSYTSMRKLIAVLGQADSTDENVDACSYHFEDGTAYYFYKDSSCFEVLQDSVILQEFRFAKNNYLLFKNIKLTSQTTLKEMMARFPNAAKDVDEFDWNNEGNFKIMRLRDSENIESDGHIRILFKRDKLYLIYQFFPC